MEPAFDSFAEAMRAQGTYLESLPVWVGMWMNWMMFAFLSSIWFVIARAEARWVFLVTILTGLGSALVGYLFGWSRLWGSVHIVLWTPLLIYLWRRRPALSEKTGFALWANLLMATMAISLAFDIVDVIRFAAGDP